MSHRAKTQPQVYQMQSLWPRTSHVVPPPGRREPRAPTSHLALELQYIVLEYLTSGLWAFSSLLPLPLTHVLCHRLSSVSNLQLPPSLPDSFTFKLCYVSLLLRCLSRRFQNLYYGYSKAFHNPSPNRLSKNVIDMLKWNPVFHFKASSNAMTVSALGFGACPLSPFRLDRSHPQDLLQIPTSWQFSWSPQATRALKHLE